jgi:hypothetical protein
MPMEMKVSRLMWMLISDSGIQDLTWMEMGVTVGFLMALNIWSQRNSKGAVRWPLVGMLPSLILNVHRLYDWGTDMLRDSGGTHVFKGPWRSNLDAVVCCDPEIRGCREISPAFTSTLGVFVSSWRNRCPKR